MKNGQTGALRVMEREDLERTLVRQEADRWRETGAFWVGVFVGCFSVLALLAVAELLTWVR